MATGTGDVDLSGELEDWLDEDPHKTFGEMVDVFEERGFAIAVALTLSVPALPLPTGGVSHAFEAVALVVAA